MVDIPLVPSDFQRRVAQESTLTLRNRFAENNPSLNDSPVSVISRPGLKKLTEAGTGPVRKLFCQPGTFDNDMFVVSGTSLYQVGRDSSVSLIGALEVDPLGSISMAATAPIGDTVPSYLFIADGGVLWVYTTNGTALGHLQVSGAIANNNTITIDGVYYKWTNAGVDSDLSADGTSGHPWLVLYTGVNATDLTAMYDAINASGTAGTTYSTALTAHLTVKAVSVGSGDLYVQARTPGAASNSIALAETGANTAWTASTLAGGGSAQLRQIQLPEDYGAISLAHINSYIIVIPVQEEAIKGRFYWIEPGETSIDPLNFATAERSPDGVNQVVVFGEMFWLLGDDTTEPWITTGDITAPMQRFQGILFDRGAWSGTAIAIKGGLMVIDPDGGVFYITSQPTRVSTPAIEERIRQSIQRQGLEIGVS